MPAQSRTEYMRAYRQTASGRDAVRRANARASAKRRAAGYVYRRPTATQILQSVLNTWRTQ